MKTATHSEEQGSHSQGNYTSTSVANCPDFEAPPLEAYADAMLDRDVIELGDPLADTWAFHSYEDMRDPSQPYTGPEVVHSALGLGGKQRNQQTGQQSAASPGSQAEEIFAVADPKPLMPDIKDAVPYPVEALPPIMRDAARAIAEHVQAPPALAGQCVIGAAAYLAQTRVNAPHMHNSNGMPCSLFLLTLADSGDRKSECRRLAFKTVDEAEEQARTAHRQIHDEINKMADGLKGKDLERFLAEHPPAPDPRTQYSDATFERIVGDMIRGVSAASWDTDEGGQVLGGASLKADTRTATLGGLVKAFDTGTFERTRAISNLDGSGFAYNRRLSVHLLAQAVTVAAALHDPLLRGQGFLPRFLFASPASIAGTRFLTAEQLNRQSYSDPRLRRYWARCEEIAATAQAISPETGEVKPQVLELTRDAENDWREFYNEVEGEQSPLGKFVNLRPFAGRAGEIARRLAAVFACFEGQGEIDSDCMCRAAEIVRYSLSEWARYTDSEAIDPSLKKAQDLIDWLKDKGWTAFSKTKLSQCGPTGLRSNAILRADLLGILVEHYHLLTSDGKIFTVN
ncbi:DUF3987 domain-containing protein [Pseudomonas sp. 2FE]|uniref:DUF3987 domain-containing protein n=1 Tax=Pseudomonas sp. 2FE TaxID=2502190 RepID=UPI002114877A|nr:DUF3987 domain-containing protein [Pseudomonas sp. 2FE]